MWSCWNFLEKTREITWTYSWRIVAIWNHCALRGSERGESGSWRDWVRERGKEGEYIGRESSSKYVLDHQPTGSDLFMLFFWKSQKIIFIYDDLKEKSWSIYWINWKHKLKLNTKTQIFLLITFRLCYTL